ncbi:hypothetical protein I4U23_003891 [Adineta vaga]|nr:hypothetical protein I4U23_003891 [Adineta vaga]
MYAIFLVIIQLRHPFKQLNIILQPSGNSSSQIEPVVAADRRNVSSLLAQETTGFVLVGDRSATLLVTLTRFIGTKNNGNVDNINFYLYQ